MPVLPAQTLRQIKPLSPFCERGVSAGMSFGVGPAGYDIRIGESLLLWPGRFVLAFALEHFEMPEDLLGVVHDKSTWVRRGLTVHNTVVEPGWRGFLTLELKLHAPRFIRLRIGMPIAQVVFHRLEQPTSDPYRGKYQDQAPGAQAARRERQDA